MEDFYVAIGDSASFSKTVGEYDVYSYAGLTGDFSPNHINEAEMRKTAYGRRIAHGAMMVGFMSTTSTLVAEKAYRADAPETPVSLGYDRIRFLAPVFIGDTITVTYRVAEIDVVKRRALSNIEVRNEEGVLVAVGQHILKWVARDRQGQ